jgi:hypothetical protein
MRLYFSSILLYQIADKDPTWHSVRRLNSRHALAREKQYRLQLKQENIDAPNPEPELIPDGIERDDIWDEEFEYVRPATNEEQAIIDSAREEQYQLQLKLEAAPKAHLWHYEIKEEPHSSFYFPIFLDFMSVFGLWQWSVQVM